MFVKILHGFRGENANVIYALSQLKNMKPGFSINPWMSRENFEDPENSCIPEPFDSKLGRVHLGLMVKADNYLPQERWLFQIKRTF